jgi:crossover junction endodeoxyribonuclease RuvC
MQEERHGQVAQNSQVHPSKEPTMIAVYAGIDPGLGGAIAFLDEDGHLLNVWDTPTMDVKKGKGHKRLYMVSEMADLLTHSQPGASFSPKEIRMVGIELIHAMPKNGSISGFRLGQGLGLWEMACAARYIPYEWIIPQRWKKELLGAGVGSDKRASIVRAQELIPSCAQYLKRKKDDGRADAILIAEYTRRRALGRIKV